jgi:phosphate:Na+ symporter
MSWESVQNHLIQLIGGMSLFLLGMTMASQSLEKIMAKRISQILNKLSQSQLIAIFVGVLLTTLLQSSGAVTSMLVGLGSARVITLQQVMGVIIGTAIGSTLTVQLISFNLNQFGLPVFSIAFLIYFLTKRNTLKNISQIFMGFGLIFFGLTMMSGAAHYFAALPELASSFQELRNHPIISLTLSMVFCGLIHSSAVAIGLAMSLATAGVISTGDALLWVYGANIGTTSTAIMAAASSNHIGKQVAWAHFFYKVVSVLLFFPFSDYFVAELESLQTSPSRTIANSHFFFNLISAGVFYPFIKWGALMMEKIFPKNVAEEFGTEYLKLNNYKSTSLAISYGEREIMRAADIVLNMIKDSIKLFSNYNIPLVDSIKDRDNKVDFLYREIKMFLLEHANTSSTEVNQRIMDMIMFLSDLERAADSIDINLITLASKKSALKLEFSQDGWDELKNMHEQVMKVAAMAINAFHTRELCDEVIRLKRDLAKIELTLREKHIGRLNRGVRDSINTSSIHLDVLSEYRRIASLLVSHAYKGSTMSDGGTGQTPGALPSTGE